MPKVKVHRGGGGVGGMHPQEILKFSFSKIHFLRFHREINEKMN